MLTAPLTYTYIYITLETACDYGRYVIVMCFHGNVQFFQMSQTHMTALRTFERVLSSEV